MPKICRNISQYFQKYICGSHRRSGPDAGHGLPESHRECYVVDAGEDNASHAHVFDMFWEIEFLAAHFSTVTWPQSHWLQRQHWRWAACTHSSPGQAQREAQPIVPYPNVRRMRKDNYPGRCQMARTHDNELWNWIGSAPHHINGYAEQMTTPSLKLPKPASVTTYPSF